MGALHYYTDTLVEYEVAKMRKKALLDKKEAIWVRYFGVKSPAMSDIPKTQTNDYHDKMICYLEETEIQKFNGYTLVEEIEIVDKEIIRLRNVLNGMEEKLAKLDSIEDELYYEVVVNKQKITEAVRDIASNKFVSESVIWKRYYPLIKEDLNKIKKIVKVQ